MRTQIPYLSTERLALDIPSPINGFYLDETQRAVPKSLEKSFCLTMPCGILPKFQYRHLLFLCLKEILISRKFHSLEIISLIHFNLLRGNEGKAAYGIFTTAVSWTAIQHGCLLNPSPRIQLITRMHKFVRCQTLHLSWFGKGNPLFSTLLSIR